MSRIPSNLRSLGDPRHVALMSQAANGLGLPPSFSQNIGGVVGARRAALGGVLEARNPGTGILGGLVAGSAKTAGSSFAAGFVPRWDATGPHMGFCGSTYTNRGLPSPPGPFDPRWGPFTLEGRITGKAYRGCLSKPILLNDQRYAYCGTPFDDLGSIVGAKRGLPFPSLVHPLARTLRNLLINYPPATAAGRPVSSRSVAAATNGSNRADSTSSVLSDPSLSIEEKLLLIMAKLSEYFDDELNEKLDEVSAHTQKQSGKNGASNSNLQALQVEIQVLMQNRQQMFQTMSGILKSVHETSMSAVRNMKA